VILAIALITVSIPIAAFALLPGDLRARRQAQANLARGMSAGGPVDERPESPLREVALRLVSAKGKARLDRLHARAGRPAAWSLERAVIMKPALAGALAALGALLLALRPGGLLVALVALVTVVGYFVPDLLLHSRGTERQTAIGLELPDTLDQMLIAVEAGLGFEAAMTRAGENGKGPLAEEFVRTLQDMSVGMSRRDAYQALSRRTDVPDLNAFIRAVVQADAYGIAISSVLRVQAKEMRVKRRQRAEEKAMQIPIKVLFPLMLFILPVLFIAVLGPTVIRVVSGD
jgi:tight adherence protein C